MPPRVLDNALGPDWLDRMDHLTIRKSETLEDEMPMTSPSLSVASK